MAGTSTDSDESDARMQHEDFYTNAAMYWEVSCITSYDVYIATYTLRPLLLYISFS